MGSRTTTAAGRDSRPFAVYARLSRRKPERPGQRWARADDETVERQVRDIRAYAAQQGLTLDDAHVYIDPNFSAWKRKGGQRPAWLRMMAAATAGELRGILVWKLDRFTRAPRDMEDLIDLAESHGVTIDGPDSGHIDLTTSTGQQRARGAATQAAAESSNTSERVKKALVAARSDGYILGGPRVFGFLTSSSSEHHPEEAAILREAAARVLAGETTASVARDLSTRGVVTAAGGDFSAATLARTLTRARYGGWIEHTRTEPVNGKSTSVTEIVGKMNGEPIFDAATYDALRSLFTSRRRGRRSGDNFRLTGIARCGRCGRTMAGAYATKNRAKGTRSRVYRCPAQSNGCGLTIRADTVEAEVQHEVLSLLADEKIRAAVGDRDAARNEVRANARQALDKIDAQLVALEVKWAAGELIQAAYDAAKPDLDRRRRAALADVQSAPLGTGGGTMPDAMTPEGWKVLRAGELRAVVQALQLSITVSEPLPDGPSNAPDPRRVKIQTTVRRRRSR